MDDDSSWWSFSDDVHHVGLTQLLEQSEEDELKRKLKAAKKLAATRTHQAALRAVIRMTLNDGLDDAVKTYALSEELPYDSALAASRSGALPWILKGAVKRVLKVPLDPDLVTQMEALTSVLYENQAEESAYMRTSRIQRFLHWLADRCLHGEGSLSLDREKMRVTLSLCRLHFNCHDIRRYRGELSVLQRAIQGCRLSDIERLAPLASTVPLGRTFVSNWRVVHVLTLVSYYPKNYRQVLEGAWLVERSLSLSKYIQSLVNVYADPTSGPDVDSEPRRWSVGTMASKMSMSKCRPIDGENGTAY